METVSRSSSRAVSESPARPSVLEETGRDIDVSDDPVAPNLARLQHMIEQITHDATDGESETDYHSDEIAMLKRLFHDDREGKFVSKPEDEMELQMINDLRRKLAAQIRKDLPGADTGNPEQMEVIRAYFQSHLEEGFKTEMQVLVDRLVAHQGAIEQATEPDVPQRGDDNVEFLREMGIVLPLESGQTDPKAIAKDIVEAFKRAEIDQDIEGMRKLLRLVGVKAAREAPYLATEDASHFASVLAAQLTDTAANANRRNWFIQAGIPTHPPHMRPEVLPARVSVTTAPGPSARVDDGQKLLPLQEKKGGPAPPTHPDALKEREIGQLNEELYRSMELTSAEKSRRAQTPAPIRTKPPSPDLQSPALSPIENLKRRMQENRDARGRPAVQPPIEAPEPPPPAPPARPLKKKRTPLVPKLPELNRPFGESPISIQIPKRKTPTKPAFIAPAPKVIQPLNDTEINRAILWLKPDDRFHILDTKDPDDVRLAIMRERKIRPGMNTRIFKASKGKQYKPVTDMDYTEIRRSFAMATLGTIDPMIPKHSWGDIAYVLREFPRDERYKLLQKSPEEVKAAIASSFAERTRLKQEIQELRPQVTFDYLNNLSRTELRKVREEAPKIAARDKKRIEDKAELSLEPPKSKLPSVHTAYPKERIEALVQEIKTKDPGQSLTKLRGLRIDQLRKIVENLRADTSARHFAAGFHAADAVRFMGSGASKPPLKARDVSLSVDIGRGPFGDSASRSMSVFSTTSRLDVDRRSRSRSAESVSSIMTEATVSDRRILFEQLPKDIIARANALPYERPTSLKTREEWMQWIKQAENASLGTQKVQQQARLDREARDAESSEIVPATVPLPASPTAKPASARLAPPPIGRRSSGSTRNR